MNGPMDQTYGTYTTPTRGVTLRRRYAARGEEARVDSTGGGLRDQGDGAPAPRVWTEETSGDPRGRAPGV